MTPAPTWILLAASLVIGLAALVRMAGPAPGVPDDIAGIIRLPGRLTGIIVLLFALAALVFHLGLMRRLRSRRHGEEDEPGSEAAQVPPWMRTLRQLLSILNLVVLAYLVWRGAIPLAGLLSLGQGAGSATGPTLAQPGQIGAPPLVTWTFAALALAAGLGALALAVWVTFGERLAEWWEGAAAVDPPLPPLVTAVEESLEDLRAEPDARRAIIRCYARFERVAADSGFKRKPWHTPMEFMREALPRLPVPRGTVPTLTGLFELARFSHRALGPTERDRAVDALDEIKAAIEEGRADAARR